MDSDGDTISIVESQPWLRRPSRSNVALVAVMTVQLLTRVILYCTLHYLTDFCLKDLNLSLKNTTIIIGVYIGIIYGIPAVAGALSDSFFGRYKSLFISNCVIAVGAILLMILVGLIDAGKPLSVEWRLFLLVSALLFLGFGLGSFNVILMSFGMDQIAEKSNLKLWSFFLWRSWFENLAKLLIAIPLPDKMGIVNSEGMLLKGVAVTACAALSVAIIIGGKRIFKIEKPHGGHTFRKLKLGILHSIPFRRKLPARYFQMSNLEQKQCLASIRKARKLFRKVAMFVGIFASYGVYDAIYMQIDSTYRQQSKFLSPIKGSQFHVGLTLPLVALTTITIMEIINRTRGLWQPFSNLSVIGVGIVFIICSPLSAGVLETVVRSRTWPGVDSGISAFAQTPQYVMAGISDVFLFIPAHVFVYDQSPDYIQSFMFGLNYSAGVAVFVVLYVVQVTLVDQPPYKEPNHALDTPDSYEYLFYILFGVGVFILLFLFFPLSVLYKRAAIRERDQAAAQSDIIPTESILSVNEIDYGTFESDASSVIGT